MPVAGVLTAKHSLAVLLLVLISGSPPACYAAQNITAILAAYPDLGEFSSQLTSARLADDIYNRSDGPVTVLAVNDTAMASVKTMPREAIWGHLSLHVLLDCYYDDANLQRLPLGGSTLVSTMFHDAGGGAPGVYGMVRIVKFSDASGVGFLPMAGDVAGAGVGKAAFFVKSVYGAPYNISVLQVSGVMSTVTPDAA
ncbi:hypothetical protein ACQ4PT_021874 [Festuca glaucescens]